MPLSIQSLLGKTAFAGTLLAGSVAYLYLAQRHFRAEQWGESIHRAGLERAISLEPGTAAHHYKFGRLLLFVEQDPEAAVTHLRRATELNPGIPWYWLDLAAAYRVSGQDSQYREAVEAAIRADAKTPIVAWEAANLWLSDGDTERALPFFRVVVQNDPQSARRALDLCWRATEDVPKLLATVVPPTIDAHLALLDVLTEHQQAEGAMRVWEHAVALKQYISPHDAYPFVNYLILNREPEKAAAVWQALAAYTPGLMPEVRPGETPVVNGGFEEDLQSGGLSWWMEPPEGVEVEIDSSEFHSGTRSLAIAFLGKPVQLPGLMQYLPVKPDQQYELSSFVKTSEVESASGPRWIIQDAADHHNFAAGTEWHGSNVWHEERIPFTTGPTTRMILVLLARQQQQRGITGKVWIDDVRLFQR